MTMSPSANDRAEPHNLRPLLVVISSVCSGYIAWYASGYGESCTIADLRIWVSISAALSALSVSLVLVTQQDGARAFKAAIAFATLTGVIVPSIFLIADLQCAVTGWFPVSASAYMIMAVIQRLSGKGK